MKVSINEVITGSFEFETIDFTGDPGHLCLTYIDSSRYFVGSEHLFIIRDDIQNQGLAGCGEVSVFLDGGKIHGGWYTDDGWSDYSIDYNYFLKLLRD